MASTSANVLAGAGVLSLFLGFTAAVAEPVLLKAPTVGVGQTRATGQASVLDAASGKPVAGSFVQVTDISTHVAGGTRAGTGSVSSYDQHATSSFVDAVTGASRVLSSSTITQAFDRNTGAGRPGVQGDTLGTTAHLFKLPFGSKKQTYSMWDGTAKRATDLVYVGVKTVSGLRTYEFKRVVPPTDLGLLPIFKAVPGSFVGHPEVASVAAHEWYENTDARLYVEPVTGSLVGGSSNPHLWAQTTGALSGLKVDLLKVANAAPDTATVARLVKSAKSSRARVQNLRRLPWLLGALGVLLLAGGLLVGRRLRTAPDAPAQPADGSVILPAPRDEQAVDATAVLS